MRDERVEPGEAEAYLKQYVEVTRGEPARQHADKRVLACRSGESAIAAEASVDNAGLVARDLLVDVNGPGVDPTHQVFDARESLLMEKGGGVGAPHPVMAMADDLGVAVKLVQGLRDGRERNQDRSLDLGGGIFPGFPDIYQDELVAFIQSLLEFLNGDGESHVCGLPLRTTP